MATAERMGCMRCPSGSTTSVDATALPDGSGSFARFSCGQKRPGCGKEQ